MAMITDASDTTAGAVLQQGIEDVWYPLVFFSKKLTDSQAAYSVFNRKLLEAYFSV